MKCTECNDTDMKCDDVTCSLNKGRTRIHINCVHCKKAKPCPVCVNGGNEFTSFVKSRCKILTIVGICSKCTRGVNHALTCPTLRQAETDYYSKGKQEARD
jgi:hypothetical protein